MKLKPSVTGACWPGSLIGAAVTRLMRNLDGGERAGDHQLRQRVRRLAIAFGVSLNVLRGGERHVRLPGAPAQRLPVDLRVPSCLNAGWSRPEARASSMVANTGIRLSRPLIRRILETGGRGAMRPNPHPAASARLAIRTKALSPRASQMTGPSGRAAPAAPGGRWRRSPGDHVLAGGEIQLSGMLTISIPVPLPASSGSRPGSSSSAICRHYPLVCSSHDGMMACLDV